jgi:hypothetical protein
MAHYRVRAWVDMITDSIKFQQYDGIYSMIEHLYRVIIKYKTLSHVCVSIFVDLHRVALQYDSHPDLLEELREKVIDLEMRGVAVS